MLHQPSGRKGPSPKPRKYTMRYEKIEPSSSQASPTLWGKHCGSDNRDCHTHTTSQNHCAQEGRDTIDTGCAPGPRHRDGVDMPDAGLHPHREAMHNKHTQQPGSSCCVPFCDPHVHEETRSNDTKQECNHSSANTLVPLHHVARAHQINDKSKERKKKGVHQQRVLC